MNLCDILAINLKYYRKKYNLSQEKFAEVFRYDFVLFKSNRKQKS